MILRLLIFCLLPIQIFAQDLTGIWTGTLTTENALVRYELSISENKNGLSGYSLSIFTFDGVENIGVKEITLKKKKDYYFLEDHDLVYDNYTTRGRRVMLTGKLNIDPSDPGLITGSFSTRSLDFRAPNQNNLKGEIRLQKQTDFMESGLLAQLEALNLQESLSFISSPIKKMEQAPADPAQKISFQKSVTPNEVASSPVVVKDVPAIKMEEKEEVVSANKTNPIQTTTTVTEKPATNPAVTKTKDVIVKKDPVKTTEEVIAKNTAPVKQDPEKKEEAVITKTLEPLKKETASTIPLPANNFPDASMVANSATAFSSRETEIIRNVFFTGDSLVIRLYDNGEVDGDIVSVLLNGQVIMPHVKLIARAITQTIYITPEMGDKLELVMYAENLGNLPPNTGLLTIQDGNDRYSVNFSGDFKKNSAIILTRRR